MDTLCVPAVFAGASKKRWMKEKEHENHTPSIKELHYFTHIYFEYDSGTRV